MSLEIRLIKNSEYKAVNDFFNNARNVNRPAIKTKRNFNQFEWEFLNGPYGKAIYAAAWDVDDGKEPAIIGIQCVIPIKMISSDGKILLTGKGEDTLIDFNASLKYKNTDILKELYNILFEESRIKGIEFLWGFNNIPATSKRLGFENPFKSYYGILVLNPIKTYRNIVVLKSKKSFISKLKIAILSFLSYLYSLKRRFILSHKYNYHLNFELDDNVELFKRATSDKSLCFLLQDKEYMNWRISMNPYPVKYKSFQLIDSNKIIKAQVICSINNNEAFIEQTLFDESLNKKIIFYLVKKVIQSLKKENISHMRYVGFKNTLLNKKEMKILRKIGFILTGKGEYIAFKKLSDYTKIKSEDIYFSRMYKQGTN